MTQVVSLSIGEMEAGWQFDHRKPPSTTMTEGYILAWYQPTSLIRTFTCNGLQGHFGQ